MAKHPKVISTEPRVYFCTYAAFHMYVRVHSLFRSIGGDIYDLVYGCVQVLAKLPRRCGRPALEIQVILRALMQGTTG